MDVVLRVNWLICWDHWLGQCTSRTFTGRNEGGYFFGFRVTKYIIKPTTAARTTIPMTKRKRIINSIQLKKPKNALIRKHITPWPPQGKGAFINWPQGLSRGGLGESFCWSWAATFLLLALTIRTTTITPTGGMRRHTITTKSSIRVKPDNLILMA